MIYHPDDIAIVRRIAAQLNALGSQCRFDEEGFGKDALDIVGLKLDILRSHTVGLALSPASAASQLCNELLQHAVNNSKRIVSLILDEDIKVEVHPAVADNPFVFFRERDDLAERVDELRQRLTVDEDTRLHSRLLVAADLWQRRGRRTSQLLQASQVSEARQWLARGESDPKPSPLLVEFIHSSRRHRQPGKPALPRPRLGLAIMLIIGLGLAFFLLRAGLEENQRARAAAAQTQAARAQSALTAAAATAANDRSLRLVDALAATSLAIGESVNQTAQARSAAATQAHHASATAQAIATQARATEIVEKARDTDAARLVEAASAALDKGDSELSLALAWVAKDALDDPKPAYRVLRRAASMASSARMESLAMPRFQPGGQRFALLADDGLSLRIVDSADWQMEADLGDQGAAITALQYSPSGDRLITAGDDGEIVIREGDTGAVLQRLAGHAGAVSAIAFAPAGERFFTAGGEPMLAAWDSQSGDLLARVSAGEGDPGQIDDLLVTADGGRIIGWWTADGEPLMAQWTADSLERLEAESGMVYRGYDNRGRYGYSGGRSLPAYPGDSNLGALAIYELASGAEIARLEEGFNWSLSDLSVPSDDLQFIAFDDDVALIGLSSSDGSRRALLVSLPAGAVLQVYESELSASVQSAAFIDRQSLLSLTRDGRLIIWSSLDGSLAREVAGAGLGLTDFRFDATANTIIGRTEGGQAHLWRLRASGGAGKQLLPEALPGSGISPDGEFLLVRKASGLRRISLATGDTAQELAAQYAIQRGAFFAVLAKERLRLFDSMSGEELHDWQVAWDELDFLHLAADGEWLLARARDGGVWLLGRESESATKLDAFSGGAPTRVAFSTVRERMLILRQDRAVLWDLGSGQALGRYAFDADLVKAVDGTFAPDGSLTFFASLADGLASLTRLAPPENLLSRHTFMGVEAGHLSEDGRALLLHLHDGDSQLIDAASAELLARLPQAGDGARLWRHLPEMGLAAIATENTLTLWDLNDGQVEQSIQHSQPIADFSISDEASHILTRDATGDHHLWRMETAAELLRRIETEHEPRALTCAERVRHLVLPLCD